MSACGYICAPGRSQHTRCEELGVCQASRSGDPVYLKVQGADGAVEYHKVDDLVRERRSA